MDSSTTARLLVDVAEATSEQAVLERVVEAAAALTGADYAIALLVGGDGAPSALAHRGMTTGEVAELPRLPRPVGLIALVLRGEALHLDDMGSHPDAVGFPLRHVPMAGMLGLPVTDGGRVLGGLFLTRRPARAPFSGQEAAVAASAARQAGLTAAALRERTAHSDVLSRIGATTQRATDGAHDPDAGTASPVVQRLLSAARDVLGMELAVLSRIARGEQTMTHVDGDGPVVLGETVPAEGGYCALMLEERLPGSVPDLRADPRTAGLPSTTERGLAAYCGVPVHLPDGSLYGSLCGLSTTPGVAATGAQLATMTVLARLVGDRLQEERQADEKRYAAARSFLPLLVEGPRRSVVLQPVVALEGGAVAGYEALTRFTDTGGAPRRPDLVFADAHALGVGRRLEQAAVRSALGLLPQLPAGAFLSVNLSPRALLLPSTRDLLAASLQEGGAGRLVVELTEHEVVDDYPALLAVLDGLRAQGLRVAVDDTGAGFASLQHVTLLQPDVVKLDIAFVRDVHLDPARRAVARSVLGLAQELGADLIAEGVETAEEQAELVRLGAPLGQGYHLGRPLPALAALAA